MNIVFFFQSGLPVFTGPFALTSLLVLATSDTKGNLYRVEKMSYPEKQCYEWHSGKKDTNTSWDYYYLRFSFTNNKISVIDLAQNKIFGTIGEKLMYNEFLESVLCHNNLIECSIPKFPQGHISHVTFCKLCESFKSNR